MTASLRQTANTVAGSMIEAASMASALIGGAGGAYLGHPLAPASWSGDLRLAFAGAVAVVGAVAIDGLTELGLAPLRRLMWKNRSVARTGRKPVPAPPATVDESLAQVATATEEDAAHRAANAAFAVDEGDGFLREEDRWRGYEDGEASFYLAPGLVLHHRTVQGQYGPKHEFTLLSGDSEQPVTVTGIAQIRHQLAARAAGLPVSEPVDDAKNDALHAA